MIGSLPGLMLFSWKSLEASWAAVIMLHMQERWDVRPHYTSFPLAVC